MGGDVRMARQLGGDELGDALQAAAGRACGDALRAVASAYRAYARAHPDGYAATQRVRDLEDAQAAAATVVDTIQAILRGYRLEEEQAVRSALHGFLALAAGEGFGRPADVE